LQQIQTTSSKHLSFRSNEKGITLIETIASMLIVGFAFVGLYQAFAYGDIFVDKTGVRRMAIGYVQAELEYWRKIRDRQVSSQLLKFSVGQNEKKDRRVGSQPQTFRRVANGYFVSTVRSKPFVSKVIHNTHLLYWMER